MGIGTQRKQTANTVTIQVANKMTTKPRLFTLLMKRSVDYWIIVSGNINCTEIVTLKAAYLLIKNDSVTCEIGRGGRCCQNHVKKILTK